MKIKDLKEGEYFTKKDIEYPKESQVWVRGEYDRSQKKYRIYKWEDIFTEQYVNGDKEVFTNLIF